MNPKVIAPETILDHVIAYTIGAGEVIQEALPSKLWIASTYDMALVPYGPPFYTAILQAAGALSVSKKIDTALIIYQQSHQPDYITMSQDIWPILGKTFLFPEKLKTLTKNKIIKCEETIDENIENQMYFIRVLSDIQHVVTIGVGDDVKKKEIRNIVDFINKKMETISFFVSNLSQEKEFTACRKNDEKLIANIIASKFQNTTKNKIPEIFSDISKKLKKIPQIVAYSNSGDLGGNKQKTNGYACMIA